MLNLFTKHKSERIVFEESLNAFALYIKDQILYIGSYELCETYLKGFKNNTWR